MKKIENVKDVTLKVLISIRDEITGLRKDNISIRDEIVKLREDTDTRFEQLRDEIVGLRGEVVQLRGEFVEMKQDMNSMKQDIAFMKQDIASVKQDMKAVAAHFDRDYLFLANDVGNLKGRVEACEKALKIAS